MFLLDTNVISELRVGKANPSAAVRRWAAGISGNQLYLSAISVLELETGILLMERKDARQGHILRSWFQAVMKEFSSQVLPFGSTTAVLCAAMHVPDRRPDRDAMIAATAREHGYRGHLKKRNIAYAKGGRRRLRACEGAGSRLPRRAC